MRETLGISRKMKISRGRRRGTDRVSARASVPHPEETRAEILQKMRGRQPSLGIRGLRVPRGWMENPLEAALGQLQLSERWMGIARARVAGPKPSQALAACMQEGRCDS
jgi:hypothetical protein